MTYLCEATSVAGVVQQLVTWFSHGYVYYAINTIGGDENVAKVDAAIIAKYDCALSDATRSRRKKSGTAVVQYIRYKHVMVIVATPGLGQFFEDEPYRDAGKVALVFHGYAIRLTEHGVRVVIAKDRYQRLERRFCQRAHSWSKERLEATLHALPYVPRYGPICSQLCKLVRRINEVRKERGFPLVDQKCLRLYAKPVLPYGPYRKRPPKRGRLARKAFPYLPSARKGVERWFTQVTGEPRLSCNGISGSGCEGLPLYRL